MKGDILAGWTHVTPLMMQKCLFCGHFILWEGLLMFCPVVKDTDLQPRLFAHLPYHVLCFVTFLTTLDVWQELVLLC